MQKPIYIAYCIHAHKMKLYTYTLIHIIGVINRVDIFKYEGGIRINVHVGVEGKLNVFLESSALLSAHRT